MLATTLLLAVATAPGAETAYPVGALSTLVFVLAFAGWVAFKVLRELSRPDVDPERERVFATHTSERPPLRLVVGGSNDEG